MQTELCKKIGVALPIFGFSHCKDVVVEISRAGGLGCLGSAYFDPLELREELNWIDSKIGANIYGVNILFNKRRLSGDADREVEAKYEELPARHRQFVETLLAQHNVPKWPESDEPGLSGMAYEAGVELFEECLRHPKCKVIVGSMASPPGEVVAKSHKTGRWVGALSGSKRHALMHKKNDLDFVIANGHEGGGHTGNIGSIVLWPEIVDAVAPLPVLAAGGVGNGRQVLAALAMGAQGVWTGSVWLTVTEADAGPEQRASYLKATSDDAIITRTWSGKTARALRNEWTESWNTAEAPEILKNPEQWLLTADARRRIQRYAERPHVQNIGFNPAGQVIGLLNEIENTKDVISRLMIEYVDAYERLKELTPDD